MQPSAPTGFPGTSKSAPPVTDQWSTGDIHDWYTGRRSRPIATEFIKWLDVDRGSAWRDVGCGTGSLTSTSRDFATPSLLAGIGPSSAFIDHARNTLGHAAELKVDLARGRGGLDEWSHDSPPFVQCDSARWRAPSRSAPARTKAPRRLHSAISIGGATSVVMVSTSWRYTMPAGEEGNSSAAGEPLSPPAATAVSRGIEARSGTPMVSARCWPPPDPNIAVIVPSGLIDGPMFSMTPATRR